MFNSDAEAGVYAILSNVVTGIQLEKLPMSLISVETEIMVENNQLEIDVLDTHNIIKIPIINIQNIPNVYIKNLLCG